MKSLLLGSYLVASLLGGNDKMICEVVPLSEYGFSGTENERVCKNIFDYTDFIIVEVEEETKEGTLLLVD